MKTKYSILALAAFLLLLTGCEKDNDGGIPQQDVTNAFIVERNKSDKEYRLEMKKEGNWEVFAGKSDGSIDMTTPVARGNGEMTCILDNYSSAERMFFRYVWEQNSSTVASERLLPMEGAYNVRDMGGYQTTDGKSVKWGMVFRSGDLNKLTDNDLSYLANVGIKTIVDFRDEDEKESAPDKLPSTHLRSYEFPISAGNVIDMSKITSEEAAAQALIDGNVFFVEECQEQYSNFFAELMKAENPPLLFHCSAGKDRAGLASALFLASLGVDKETIIKDYLLSGEYVREKYKDLVEAMPILGPVFTVKTEYIETAFQTIDSKYGGIEKFLSENLNVDLSLMKSLYTE